MAGSELHQGDGRHSVRKTSKYVCSTQSSRRVEQGMSGNPDQSLMGGMSGACQSAKRVRNGRYPACVEIKEFLLLL